MNKLLKPRFLLRTVSIFFIFCLFVFCIPLNLPVVNASEDTTNTLLFTSDVHTYTDHLDTWLKRTQKAGITSPDYMCFGGDYASSFSTDDISAVKDTLTAYYPDTTGIFTTGNHEAKHLDEEAFDSLCGYPSTGYSVINDNYILYTFGATTSKQTFVKSDIKKLKTFLNSLTQEQQQLPIFIISHYPLHRCENRQSTNASNVITLLNKFPNVIFLYGHTHTNSDPMYGTVQTSGDTLEINKDGTTRKIKFTYASMGSMKEGAKQQVYGLVAQVTSTDTSRTVTLRYRSLKKYLGTAVTICF